jgi:HSP20 family protein
LLARFIETPHRRFGSPKFEGYLIELPLRCDAPLEERLDARALALREFEAGLRGAKCFVRFAHARLQARYRPGVASAGRRVGLLTVQGVFTSRLDCEAPLRGVRVASAAERGGDAMARYWLSNPRSNDPLASFDQLRRGMDELFERVEARTTRRAGAFRPVNLYETTNDYVLTAELPGLGGDDIDVSVERNRVTLRGERKIDHPSDASLHRVERQAGVFRRTIELPGDVDADKAQAVYRNGVLMLQIPKAAAHQPRQIAVKES